MDHQYINKILVIAAERKFVAYRALRTNPVCDIPEAALMA